MQYSRGSAGKKQSEAKQNPALVIGAILLSALAVGLLLWQFVLRPSPEAVGVEDMPPEVRATGTEQRDPAAGPVPVDVSRQRGGGGR